MGSTESLSQNGLKERHSVTNLLTNEQIKAGQALVDESIRGVQKLRISICTLAEPQGQLESAGRKHLIENLTAIESALAANRGNNAGIAHDPRQKTQSGLVALSKGIRSLSDMLTPVPDGTDGTLSSVLSDPRSRMTFDFHLAKALKTAESELGVKLQPSFTLTDAARFVVTNAVPEEGAAASFLEGVAKFGVRAGETLQNLTGRLELGLRNLRLPSLTPAYEYAGTSLTNSIKVGQAGVRPANSISQMRNIVGEYRYYPDGVRFTFESAEVPSSASTNNDLLGGVGGADVTKLSDGLESGRLRDAAVAIESGRLSPQEAERKMHEAILDMLKRAK